MSKSEDRYLEHFQDGRLRNCSSKESFLLGYHQAEKDLRDISWIKEISGVKELSRAKEEALKAEKRLRRIKRLRHKQNQRYYAKKKKERENERQAKGDDKAYRMILIVKNHKRVKRLGCAWWKTEAYRIYNEALEKNHQEVKFPVKFRTHEGASRKNNKIETNKRK